jgi:hypothetical protein
MKFLAGVVFCPLISALVFDVPKITPVGDNLRPQGWSPRPTEAPNFKELVKRQSSTNLSLIEGPDFLCGYQFGNSGKSLIRSARLSLLIILSDYGLALCGQTSRCGFGTAPGQPGEIFCFGTTTSVSRPSWTSCFDGIYATSCLADPACSDNQDIYWYGVFFGGEIWKTLC